MNARVNPLGLAVALALMAGQVAQAQNPPSPALSNPSSYSASGPGSAKRCETIKVVLTANPGGSIWNRAFWTSGFRLERGYVHKQFGSSVLSSSNGNDLYCWSNDGLWFAPSCPWGPATYELTAIGAPGSKQYAWSQYGWDTIGTLSYQSNVVETLIGPGDTGAVSISNGGYDEIPADGTTTLAIYVKCMDGNCAPVAGQSVTVSTNKGLLRAGGVESQSLTLTTSAAGQVTPTLVADTVPGMATITASFQGHSGVTTVYMTGNTITLAANPTSIAADNTSTSAISGTVRDMYGLTTAGAAVTLSTTAGYLSAGTQAGSSVELTTDASGAFSATLRSTSWPATATVTATTDNADAATVNVTFSYDPAGDLGPNQDVPYTNDPVHAGAGNYTFSKRLFSMPGKGLPLGLSVYYNSLANGRDGPLGWGWTHSLNVLLSGTGSPNLILRWGDGHTDRFLDNSDGTFTNQSTPPDVRMSRPDLSHYDATLPSGTRYRFDGFGGLVSIADLNGNTITLSHSAYLDQAVDAAGRVVTFTYSNGRLSSIASPAGTWAFVVDASGHLTTITDPLSHAWTFTYDTAHRMLTQVDANGNAQVTNTYDDAGLIISQKDALGHTTAFARTTDASGTSVKITAPSGRSAWHYYDTSMNVTRIVDAAGKEATFTYDANGRRLTATDKAGGSDANQYDTAGNLTGVRDALSHATSYTYDAQNRPTQVTDAAGNATTFTWDAAGNMTQMRAPTGHNLDFTHNAAGQPLTVTSPGAKTSTFSYNAAGLVQTATDPLGHTTTYTYDAAGRPTVVTLASGASIQTSYDAAGKVASITDVLGHVTTFAHDANGNVTSRTFVTTAATTQYTFDTANRVVRVTDALGGQAVTTYDADSNVQSVTDADGVRTTYEHDAAGRVASILDALGNRTQFTYDANGRLASTRDALGRTWRYTYDAAGQLLQVTDPLGSTSKSAYDALGRPTSATDALDRQTTYEYDTLGRMTKAAAPGFRVSQQAYDADGNVTSHTDALGHSWQYTYDAAGLLRTTTDPVGRSASVTRNAMGHVTSAQTRAGAAITTTFDLAGRPVSVAYPGTSATQYTYDAAGNLATVTNAAGTVSMAYDKLGRRTSLTEVSGQTMAYAYTAAGRLASMTYPGSKTLTYRYDTVGRLSTMRDWAGHDTTFTYDAAGQLTRIDLPNGTRTEYGYDLAGRRTSLTNRKADGSVLRRYAYTYNAVGQVTRADRTEPLAAGAASASTTYTYDAANRIATATSGGVTTTFTYDANGNLTTRSGGGATTTYAYDALGHLTSVTGGSGVTTYTYDGRGAQADRSVNGSQTRYLRDGGTVYCALDDSGTIQEYHLGAGTLLYSLDASGGMKVYHPDERGSVVSITDASANEVASYSYSPYGRVLASTGSASSEFQFVGTRFVTAEANGLYHMGARFYDADTRRFLTEDPLGHGAGPNFYQYGGGDPVNQIDPSGLIGEMFGFHPDVAEAMETWLFYPDVVNRDIGELIPSENEFFGWPKVGEVTIDDKLAVDYLLKTRTTEEIADHLAHENLIYRGRPLPTTECGYSMEYLDARISEIISRNIPRPTGLRPITSPMPVEPAILPSAPPTTILPEAPALLARTAGSIVTESGMGAVRAFLTRGMVGTVIRGGAKAVFLAAWGYENWVWGREVGGTPRWDPIHNRYTSIDEIVTNLWYNNLPAHGWWQPQPFQSINPDKYVQWQDRRFNDGILSNKGK